MNNKKFSMNLWRCIFEKFYDKYQDKLLDVERKYMVWCSKNKMVKYIFKTINTQYIKDIENMNKNSEILISGWNTSFLIFF